MIMQSWKNQLKITQNNCTHTTLHNCTYKKRKERIIDITQIINKDISSKISLFLSTGARVLEALRQDEQFVRCLHAVGTGGGVTGWPCDPPRTIILHKPADNEIVSYGKLLYKNYKISNGSSTFRRILNYFVNIFCEVTITID